MQKNISLNTHTYYDIVEKWRVEGDRRALKK